MLDALPISACSTSYENSKLAILDCYKINPPCMLGGSMARSAAETGKLETRWL